ncbi:MAG: hypothetical protein ABIE14_02185 [Patescibacteria group bacterium]
MEKPKLKWYFKTSFLMVTFLMVGPFVLPLILWHPSFSPEKKLLLGFSIIALSYLIGIALSKSLESIEAYYSLADF